MSEQYKFINPPLPYNYNDLEPYIDAKTIHLHRDKHLQTYIDNLNKILANYPEYQNIPLEHLILYANALPLEIQTAVKNNAGGVYNHIYYFYSLSKPSTDSIPEQLASHIVFNFNDIDTFKKQFRDAALSVFGSGYAWLVFTPFGKLKIITTTNQDTPLTLGLCPILNIDVWEHAYYLKHYNLRADYLDDWFHVINWEQANQNLLTCLKTYS